MYVRRSGVEEVLNELVNKQLSRFFIPIKYTFCFVKISMKIYLDIACWADLVSPKATFALTTQSGIGRREETDCITFTLGLLCTEDH